MHPSAFFAAQTKKNKTLKKITNKMSDSRVIVPPFRGCPLQAGRAFHWALVMRNGRWLVHLLKKFPSLLRATDSRGVPFTYIIARMARPCQIAFNCNLRLWMNLDIDGVLCHVPNLAMLAPGFAAMLFDNLLFSPYDFQDYTEESDMLVSNVPRNTRMALRLLREAKVAVRRRHIPEFPNLLKAAFDSWKDDPTASLLKALLDGFLNFDKLRVLKLMHLCMHRNGVPLTATQPASLRVGKMLHEAYNLMPAAAQTSAASVGIWSTGCAVFNPVAYFFTEFASVVSAFCSVITAFPVGRQPTPGELREMKTRIAAETRMFARFSDRVVQVFMKHGFCNCKTASSSFFDKSISGYARTKMYIMTSFLRNSVCGHMRRRNITQLSLVEAIGMTLWQNKRELKDMAPRDYDLEKDRMPRGSLFKAYTRLRDPQACPTCAGNRYRKCTNFLGPRCLSLGDAIESALDKDNDPHEDCVDWFFQRASAQDKALCWPIACVCDDEDIAEQFLPFAERNKARAIITVGAPNSSLVFLEHFQFRDPLLLIEQVNRCWCDSWQHFRDGGLLFFRRMLELSDWPVTDPDEEEKVITLECLDEAVVGLQVVPTRNDVFSANGITILKSTVCGAAQAAMTLMLAQRLRAVWPGKVDMYEARRICRDARNTDLTSTVPGKARAAEMAWEQVERFDLSESCQRVVELKASRTSD